MAKSDKEPFSAEGHDSDKSQEEKEETTSWTRCGGLGTKVEGILAARVPLACYQRDARI